MNKNITFVTALFDIGRGDLKSGFSRSFDHYIECFERLLKIDHPMIIYVEHKLEDIIWKHRRKDNTQLVFRDVETLKDFPFFEQVNNIRQQKEWINRSGWIPDSTQAKLELYNPLVMSKHFYLNDATIMNPFNTDYFMWVDAGISNTIGDPTYYFDNEYPEKIKNDLKKMYYVAFPYDGNVEVHGFEKKAMNSYANADTKYVCRGGLFGGSKEIINEFNEYYYHMLGRTLHDGYMGTEESVFTILTYLHPEKCHIEMIEDNGLIVTYLERVKNKKIKKYDPRLAVYVLTYNLPEQLELWCENFEKYIKSEPTPIVKYLINNSTDKSVRNKYKKLVEKYEFEEIEFPENIGICGGRYWAAQHFEKSNFKHMVFFEDDMMMNSNFKTPEFCKNGFNRNISQILKKGIMIVEREELDYLKLTFTEFYGDNHLNWAWENINESEREKYFPHDKDKPNTKKTNIYYTASLRNVPYAVGEYHYCNWPLIVSREGNKKIFLEDDNKFKMEQTWMGDVMKKISKRKIRAGCLLASTITHNRVHHYDGKGRKENNVK